MAELLKHSYDLAVLRLSLGPPGEYDRVVFDLEVNRRRAWVLEIPAEDPEIRPVDLNLQGPELSKQHLITLGTRLTEILHAEPHRPLWLELGHPAGYLAAVPWERLLYQHVSDAAVLRLPFFSLPPVVPNERLRVALCATGPAAHGQSLPALVSKELSIMDQSLPGPVEVEVFIHSAHVDDLHDDMAGWNLKRLRVTVHDSREADGLGVAERAPVPAGTANPWLAWMGAALATRSVDIVQFLCPGYMSAGRGALALESPLASEDQAWARFVGAAQLSAFMTRVGAWSLHLAPSIIQHSWDAGLVLLANDIARLRPGHVLLEDPADREKTALTKAHQFLYRSSAHPPLTQSTPLVLYCHPGLLRHGRDWDRLISGMPEVASAVNQFTAARGATGDVLRGSRPAPAWLAANQRYLEQRTAMLVDNPPSATPEDDPEAATLDRRQQDPARQGTAAALTFVADAIKRHCGSGMQ
jgi:hypothetical protein